MEEKNFGSDVPPQGEKWGMSAVEYDNAKAELGYQFAESIQTLDILMQNNPEVKEFLEKKGSIMEAQRIVGDVPNNDVLYNSLTLEQFMESLGGWKENDDERQNAIDKMTALHDSLVDTIRDINQYLDNVELDRKES